MKFINQKNLFKLIGASALATCMLATSLFAFIPNSNNSNLTANAQNNETTTESAGLITPRADDPVLFTTESGIEIKYGNATIQGNLTSGNLTGFPYFTTTKDSTTYVWVMIGTRSGELLDQFSTPAAQTISCSGGAHLQTYFGKTATVHEEIPDGGVLCLANFLIGSYTYEMKNSPYIGGSVDSAFSTFYSSDSFGFGTLKTKIKSTYIYHFSYGYNNSGSVKYKYANFFTLDCITDSSLSNFCAFSYLSQSQLAFTGISWARTSNNANHYFFNSDGSIGSFMMQSVNRPYYPARPAFVFDVF